MALHLPSEVVVERFLPTLRVLLASALDERGLVQEEVAGHLGVTQAAVSNYVAGEVEVEPTLADHPRTTETVERVADGLAGGTMDDYEALAEVLALVREFEDRGPICELHEAAVPALQGLGCDLCVRGFDADAHAEREVLGSVRRAARRLAGTPGMAGFIPKVGTNVGMALPDAADARDVAAIPGRVYAVGGRVEVPANPEFGASEHVATAVLAAMAVDGEVRAALNLATDDALLAAAREEAVDPLSFDADYDDRGSHLRGRFRERGSVPPVAYHRGAFGVEPVTYVFGATAEEAAAFAAELVEAAADRRAGGR